VGAGEGFPPAVAEGFNEVVTTLRTYPDKPIITGQHVVAFTDAIEVVDDPRATA
jgi:hypothetical protein